MSEHEQARAAKRERQDAWIERWKSQHVWSADGKTATPRPGWDWAREMEEHVYQGRA